MKKLASLQKILFLGFMLFVAAAVVYLSNPVEIEQQSVTKTVNSAQFE